MIIGMRGHDFGRMTPEALADAIVDAGFAATQLAFTKAFPPPAEQYMTDDALLRLRDLYAGKGIAVPVLGCYVDCGNSDAGIRRQALERFSRSLRASVLLEVKCVGTETSPFSGPEEAREEAYQGLLEFVRAAAKVAESCGATIGIEPVARHTLNTPELTQRLIRDVGSPSLKVILDLTNLISPDTQRPEDQQDLLERAVACYGPLVTALHIKNGVFNSEGKWENRPLDQGIMNWRVLLPQLSEHFPDLCALREGVWPGLAREECRYMHECLR